MTKNLVAALYVGVMIVTVVGTDLLFFRHRFWGERLIANIAIVSVFAALYFIFLWKR